MIYTVTARLTFDSEDEARDFYHDCQLALPKSIPVNPDMPNQETSYIEWHRCWHDEGSVTPCELIEHEEPPRS